MWEEEEECLCVVIVFLSEIHSGSPAGSQDSRVMKLVFCTEPRKNGAACIMFSLLMPQCPVKFDGFGSLSLSLPMNLQVIQYSIIHGWSGHQVYHHFMDTVFNLTIWNIRLSIVCLLVCWFVVHLFLCTFARLSIHLFNHPFICSHTHRPFCRIAISSDGFGFFSPDQLHIRATPAQICVFWDSGCSGL